MYSNNWFFNLALLRLNAFCCMSLIKCYENDMPKSNVPFLGQVAIQTLLPNYKKMTLRIYFIWLIFTFTDLQDIHVSKYWIKISKQFNTIDQRRTNLRLYLGNSVLSQITFILLFSMNDILPNHNMFTFYLSFYVFDSPS